MLFKNAIIEKSSIATNFRINKGKFAEFGDHLEPEDNEQVIDLRGKLILPPFVESHIHLDTTMTAGDPAYNKSGTLFEGIALWSKRKTKLTKEDVKERATHAILSELSHGTQYIRTHVDICDEKLTALKALIELKEELKNIVTLQIIAFPQEGILSYPNGKILVERAIELGVDGLGAIPHYEFTHEYAAESIKYVIAKAIEHNLFVDVHCDETDDPTSIGLETLAACTAESKYGEMVTASHTTAMHSYDNAYVSRLMRVLKIANLNFVSNPLVNMNLQGRFDSYPKRRGLTRVKELTENGLNVSFGHDDICDPWYIMGNGDLKEVLYMGLHAVQMTGYDDICDSYKFITYNGAKTLGIRDYGIAPGNPANFVVLDASNFYLALCNHSPVLYSVRNGEILVNTTPATIKINI